MLPLTSDVWNWLVTGLQTYSNLFLFIFAKTDLDLRHARLLHSTFMA